MITTILLLMSFQSAQVAPGEGSVYTVAGSDFIGDGGPARSALFLNLQGVAVSPFGFVYVADADAHRVRSIAPDGTVTTVAGTGRADFSGDGGPASLASLNTPTGLAVDYSGVLYVADKGNARIRKVTRDGVITTLAGGSTGLNLISPSNVAVDGPGHVYIADGHRILRFSPNGLTRLAGSLVPGFSGDEGPATAALLRSPSGLTLDPAGNLYIGDSGNGAIRVINAASGVITRIRDPQLSGISATGLAYSLWGELWIADGNGGPLWRMAVQQPALPLSETAAAVAVDFAGNGFTVKGDTVRKLDLRSNAAVVAGGNGYYFSGDGGDSLRARLHRPRGLAVDPGGFLYVADSLNRRIRRVSMTSGKIETVIGPAYLTDPRALFWEARLNTLYIADAGTNTVLEWTPNSVAPRVIAGNGTRGFSGDGGPGVLAQLDSPSGVTVDSASNILISDTGNGRIRLITPDGEIRTISSKVSSPTGMCWDPKGFLYVISRQTGQIVRMTQLGAIEPVISTGIQLQQPEALVLASDGSLIVADAATNLISSLTPNGQAYVLAGSERGFNGDGLASANTAKFDSPSGLALYQDKLMVADTANDRIRVLIPPRIEVFASGREQSLLERVGSRRAAETVAAGALCLISGGNWKVPSTIAAFDGTAIRVYGEGLVQIPEHIGRAGKVEFTLSRNDSVVSRQTLAIVPAAPDLLPPIVNSDGKPNSLTDPAVRGELVTVRLTGEGRESLALRVWVGVYEVEVISSLPSPSLPGTLDVSLRLPRGYISAGKYNLSLKVGEFMTEQSTELWIR